MSRHPSKCPTLSIAGDVYYMLVTGEETGGAYATCETLVSPGGGPPPHTHTREDELFHILEGEVTFLTTKGAIVAKAGETVHAPRNQQHTFTNRTSRPARMVVTSVPAGIDRMFFEIGDKLPTGSATPTPVTDAAIAKIVEACPRYGIILAPPPAR